MILLSYDVMTMFSPNQNLFNFIVKCSWLNFVVSQKSKSIFV